MEWSAMMGKTAEVERVVNKIDRRESLVQLEGEGPVTGDLQ